MRAWHELVAAAGDLVPGGVPVLGLGLLLLTTIVVMLWYWWPDWLPGRGVRGRRDRGGRWRLRWPQWRGFWSRWRLRWSRWRLRWRWRRRRPAGDGAPDPLPDDELPEVPAAALSLSADELAAQGRYREAVRERLRAIVRDLVEREVITHHPGWTVTELAWMAGQAHPGTAAPLAAASEVFSGIWYGQRPALAGHDAAMREHAARVRAAIEQSRVGV
ncbi:MAG: DUF4129 domain-containing protein [Micromonosporaceae bacterium]|nr:DUF4129 domain-containing protein [Micromonosporaceae bacterium]